MKMKMEDFDDGLVERLVTKVVRMIEAADIESELPTDEELRDHCYRGSIVAMAMFDYLLKHKPSGSGPEWDDFLKEALQESINADIQNGGGKMERMQ